MGCDIHGWVERKVGDKWIGIRPLDHLKARERNYLRFAALAGVRGHGPSPRGLPIDIGESAAYDAERWGQDGHSHSWLPLDEAARIFLEVRYPGETREDFAKSFPASYFFDVDDADLSPYRFVFWFDN